MGRKQHSTFDALVLGGGIAGLQAALDLADQDYKVAVIEKDATIGGKLRIFPRVEYDSLFT